MAFPAKAELFHIRSFFVETKETTKLKLKQFNFNYAENSKGEKIHFFP